MLNISHQGNANQTPQHNTNFTPTRMAVIKKANNNKCWQGCREIGNLVHCWQECAKWPLWETVWQFFKMLRIELPYDTTFPPRRNENICQKKPKKNPQAYMFVAALLLTAKKVEKSRYSSTDKGINKVGYACTWNLIQPQKGMKYMPPQEATSKPLCSVKRSQEQNNTSSMILFI